MRMKAAREDKGLSVKEAAAAAGIGYWSWYKKEGGEGQFSWEECVQFAETIGAPTFWPFYDWAHADDIDDRLGYGRQGSH